MVIKSIYQQPKKKTLCKIVITDDTCFLKLSFDSFQLVFMKVQTRLILYDFNILFLFKTHKKIISILKWGIGQARHVTNWPCLAYLVNGQVNFHKHCTCTKISQATLDWCEYECK